MAARLNKIWRFYVYKLVDVLGSTQYIGKGSTRRLSVQKAKFALDGYEVARFKKESDAYKYEVELIAAEHPPINKHRGGNGSRASAATVGKTNFERLYDKIGSRSMAARLWLMFANENNADLSKKDEIRVIAYG